MYSWNMYRTYLITTDLNEVYFIARAVKLK